MTPIEKLKKATGILQELYYDMENLNISEEIIKNVSVSEDLLWDSINYLENQK